MRFAIFRLHLSKLLRLPRKSDTGSYEVLHLSRKISQNHLSKPEDLMLQNATLSGNQRPDLQTCLLYRACDGKCIFADSFRMFHACHRFWKCCKTVTFCSLLTRSTIPCACHAKAHLNVQKWSQPLDVLTFWIRNVLRATTT